MQYEPLPDSDDSEEEEEDEEPEEVIDSDEDDQERPRKRRKLNESQVRKIVTMLRSISHILVGRKQAKTHDHGSI
jgi:hypothetical protein